MHVYSNVPGLNGNIIYENVLRDGTAVKAVEAAVRIMEKNENFNAGVGSLLNNSDEVECDAMIMDGHQMKTGTCIPYININENIAE